MLIKTDTHVHTVLSGHARGDIADIAKRAAGMGLEAVAITDHCSLYMSNYEESVNVLLARKIPESLYGVRLLKGAELDFHDYSGHICFYNVPYDADGSALDRLMRTLDIAIVSPHFLPESRVGSYEEITYMYLSAIANPYVTTLGHPERINADYDMTAVAIAAAQNGTFIEINAGSIQQGYGEKVARMLRICKGVGARIVVNSDAHTPELLGEVDNVKRLLIDCAFPAELVANRDYATLMTCLNEQKRCKRA
jgi:putative hydrolase